MQAQAGQTAVRSVQVAAAAVDVVPVPDGVILVHSAGEKGRGGVADDADGVRIGACAVRFHPGPRYGCRDRHLGNRGQDEISDCPP